MEVIRIAFAFLLVLACTSELSLQPEFYSVSCPMVEPMVQAAVLKAMQNDSRTAASLVRLFFHDCFVQGCDASILLDDAPSIISEKHALPNANSVRGFELIDTIKADLERLCPMTVSCADILALAARDATSLSGGPFWRIPLGRRDSLNANFSLANIALPGPSFNLSRIIFLFSTQGLNEVDLVALSGAHTFGRAKCRFFNARLFNFTGDGKPDPNMEAAFRDKLRLICPKGGNPNKLVELDHSTPNGFDNEYFKELMRSQGLLHSDQVLFSNPSALTKSVVEGFAESQILFFRQFALSMTKMGNIGSLSGRVGEVRVNCRKVN